MRPHGAGRAPPAQSPAGSSAKQTGALPCRLGSGLLAPVLQRVMTHSTALRTQPLPGPAARALPHCSAFSRAAGQHLLPQPSRAAALLWDRGRVLPPRARRGDGVTAIFKADFAAFLSPLARKLHPCPGFVPSSISCRRAGLLTDLPRLKALQRERFAKAFGSEQPPQDASERRAAPIASVLSGEGRQPGQAGTRRVLQASAMPPSSEAPHSSARCRSGAARSPSVPLSALSSEPFPCRVGSRHSSDQRPEWALRGGSGPALRPLTPTWETAQPPPFPPLPPPLLISEPLYTPPTRPLPTPLRPPGAAALSPAPPRPALSPTPPRTARTRTRSRSPSRPPSPGGAARARGGARDGGGAGGALRPEPPARRGPVSAGPGRGEGAPGRAERSGAVSALPPPGRVRSRSALQPGSGRSSAFREGSSRYRAAPGAASRIARTRSAPAGLSGAGSERRVPPCRAAAPPIAHRRPPGSVAALPRLCAPGPAPQLRGCAAGRPLAQRCVARASP